VGTTAATSDVRLPSPDEGPMSLSDLTHPTSTQEFLEECWGRRARLFPHSIAGREHELLDLRSFELLIATLPRANESWLHLARDSVKPIPARMLDAEGMLRLPELRAAFRDGETLYLTKAHRVHRPLMNLTRAVELTLESFGVRRRAAVSAHVFLTPPGAQGLRPHRDDHGSLILQLHGSKQWDIHVDERGPDDQRTVGAVGDEALLGRHESFNLESGDVL
jgi:hypothetical protein